MADQSFTLSGNIVDLIQKKIYPGTIAVVDGVIKKIASEPGKSYQQYLLPGFIDAHVHVESSMLVPSEFARLAVVHGTVATVSDPHEIGNVLGVEGVRYMIQNGEQVPFHFYFGAPSCVPATPFETAGNEITAEDIGALFKNEGLKYLSEVMNYPGVLARDPLVMNKIRAAKERGLPIDGHAPGLCGSEAACYIAAGISTDHECFTLKEALDKLKCGMHILIREGSAAKNYQALHTLLKTHPDQVMFCSDDKHPHELVIGHINQLVKRSIVEHGYDVIDVLRCACYNPVVHYNLDVGLLQEGDFADLIVIDNLRDFNIQRTYVRGELVAKEGKSLIRSVKAEVVNKFATQPKRPQEFALAAKGEHIQVIEALDGELITKKFIASAKKEGEYLLSDVKRDILKLVVCNRYENVPLAIGFIKGFGLKRGALASSIAHDSHNIIAVGVSDGEICEAVNALIEAKGGISLSDNGQIELLPLPIAGLMSAQDGYEVAQQYAKIDQSAKVLGSSLKAPFMTLSFMALLVIPSLKLSDKGLFDGNLFRFTDLLIASE